MSRAQCRTLFFLVLWGLLTSCTPYGKRVPISLLRRLPYELRIELLEAENDLAIAVDKNDEAENEVLRRRKNIRRSKERLSNAHREVGSAPDEQARQTARLAIQEAEARVNYLRLEQRVAERELQMAEHGLLCAHARFEKAKLDVARRAKVEGAESLSPKDFEKQITDCEKALSRKQKDLKKPISRAMAAKAEWEVKKQALAARTFDARASPYVE